MKARVSNIIAELGTVGIITTRRDNNDIKNHPNSETLSLFYQYNPGVGWDKTTLYIGFVRIDPSIESFSLVSFGNPPRLWYEKYIGSSFGTPSDDCFEWVANSLGDLKKQLKDWVYFCKKPMGTSTIYPDQSRNYVAETNFILEDVFGRKSGIIGKYSFVKSGDKLTIVPLISDSGMEWFKNNFKVDRVNFSSKEEIEKNGRKMQTKRRKKLNLRFKIFFQ